MSRKLQEGRARFTAWLSTRERAAIEDRARAEGASANYVVRMAIRTYLGLDEDQVSQLLHVTSDTPARQS